MNTCSTPRHTNYHWNVVGPQFNDLHEFFQAQYTALNEVADDVAERIWALGQPAIGTLAEFVQHTRLKEHLGHYPGARDMVANLLADHEAVIQRLRVDLETCVEEYHDMGTNDFLTGLMARHEKMARRVTIPLRLAQKSAPNRGAWWIG
jgi:starvation-inducible DNA-binding protein